MNPSSSILFWAKINLHTHDQNIGWWVSQHLPFTQTAWYYAPVTDQYPSSSMTVKILFPSERIFKYHRKSIYGYNGGNFNYLWIWAHQISTHFCPQPCVQCGWYCDQTCQTWGDEKYYLTSILSPPKVT